MLKYRIFFFVVLLFPIGVFASAATGLGGLASNLLEPVNAITNFVSSGAMAVGIGFIFGSFMKYMQHRKNPMAVPISNVILLLIVGLLLLCLPLAYKLVDDHTPASIVGFR